jgi:hypothetical protein
MSAVRLCGEIIWTYGTTTGPRTRWVPGPHIKRSPLGNNQRRGQPYQVKLFE